jgi:23S rRNA pseudouridine1911/1915/1917 synthase
MQFLKVVVKPQKDRLDQYVSTSIKNLSRSKANKLIKAGHILVNKAAVTADYRVRKGDSVSVEIPLQPRTSLRAEKIPLKIVYEDPEVMVVDKQPGLVVHPSVNHPSGTLVNAILSHLGDFDEDSNRPGIVHRLDKDTSGLIVLAKTQTSLEDLKEQFKDHKVEKAYLALVDGVVAKEKGIIATPIARHPRFKQKFTTDHEGKEAVTEYRVKKRFAKQTLLELFPKTGRTHQLRVHLSSIGHPIVGDKLYGGRMLLNRQFLHAAKLSFKHPKSGELLSFSSDLPKELNELLDKLN